eukprot:350843-Chlamydomonas_euryale.AAC.4
MVKSPWRSELHPPWWCPRLCGTCLSVAPGRHHNGGVAHLPLHVHRWRAELGRQGRRPSSCEIGTWYHAQSAGLWPVDPPTLQETRVHAKCLRSLPTVREYFRNYRSNRKRRSTSSGVELMGAAAGSPRRHESLGAEMRVDGRGDGPGAGRACAGEACAGADEAGESTQSDQQQSDGGAGTPPASAMRAPALVPALVPGVPHLPLGVAAVRGPPHESTASWVKRQEPPLPSPQQQRHLHHQQQHPPSPQQQQQHLQQQQQQHPPLPQQQHHRLQQQQQQQHLRQEQLYAQRVQHATARQRCLALAAAMQQHLLMVVPWACGGVGEGGAAVAGPLALAAPSAPEHHAAKDAFAERSPPPAHQHEAPASAGAAAPGAPRVSAPSLAQRSVPGKHLPPSHDQAVHNHVSPVHTSHNQFHHNLTSITLHQLNELSRDDLIRLVLLFQSELCHRLATA